MPPEDGSAGVPRRVPNGDYLVWLCAGPVIRKEYADRHFLLRVNDEVLFDETPAPYQYYSRKYLYRFLNTRYSEKPHALWANYIDRMYPVHTPHMKVTDGTFTLTAANYFVSALVLVPASAKADFDKFAETTRRLRIEAFEKTLRPLTGKEAAGESRRRRLFCSMSRPSVRRCGRGRGRRRTERKHTALQDGRGAGPDRDAAPGGHALRRPRQVLRLRCRR